GEGAVDARELVPAPLERGAPGHRDLADRVPLALGGEGARDLGEALHVLKLLERQGAGEAHAPVHAGREPGLRPGAFDGLSRSPTRAERRERRELDLAAESRVVRRELARRVEALDDLPERGERAVVALRRLERGASAGRNGRRV